ncbi:MAG: hypothetical protein VXZ82_11280 [Planctomycetota bacterium]|nr:hypothetical protein [Planctomycetota bacterium]
MSRSIITRRGFAASVAAAGFLTATVKASPNKRPKIAFLGTDVYQHSHAQHFLDRFTIGYAMNGTWREPLVENAGVYIDQFNQRDIGKQRIEKYGLKQFDSIAEALCLGGDNLAVDGVILIVEHGDYPRNEKGQKLYPRYKWFNEVVKVFEDSGRAVPVFNDKHLSTNWGECQEMVADSKRMGFALYAGSSLPVTWRLPGYDLPYGTPMRESVCVAYGGVDSYDFHALETAQCMSERRRGGEVGISSVHAVRGEKLWKMLREREDTARLFVSALCRSHSLPVETGYPTEKVTLDWAQRTLGATTGYFVEHLDGFKTSIFLTGIRDFNYAGMTAEGKLVGCQMMLPMPGRNSTTADFFNPLSRHVEEMVVSGKTIYPIERTLLTSGMVIGGVESLFSGETRWETKEMAVKYKGPEQSMFWPGA